jgi:REP element-mobilizing transposase RayT
MNKKYEVDVPSIESDKNYFHMIFTLKSNLGTPKYSNTLKTINSRET